jgi:hypothetical protein
MESNPTLFFPSSERTGEERTPLQGAVTILSPLEGFVPALRLAVALAGETINLKLLSLFNCV